MTTFRPALIPVLAALVLATGSAQSKDVAVTDMTGEWEGPVSYALRQPGQPLGTAFMLRLKITDKPVGYATQLEGESVWHPQPGILKRFKFQSRVATIAGSFLESGRDQDGLWVEFQSLVLTVKNADTLSLYQLRVVNNTELPRNDGDSTWAVLYVGELHRRPKLADQGRDWQSDDAAQRTALIANVSRQNIESLAQADSRHDGPHDASASR